LAHVACPRAQPLGQSVFAEVFIGN